MRAYDTFADAALAPVPPAARKRLPRPPRMEDVSRRRARRNPPGRPHARLRPPAGRRRRRCSSSSRRPVRAEPLPPLPRLPRGRRARRAAARAGLERAWRTARDARRGRRARSSPSRTTCACATRRSPRRPSRSPTSAAGSARACSSSSPSARGGVGIEPFVAEVLPDNRDMLGVFEAVGFELTRELAGRRGRGRVPDRSDRDLRAARRRARPHRGHRVAASVLRAAKRRRDRRLAAARLDRRRAVPQHPRGRLRRRRLPRQPRRRAGRRRARVPLDRARSRRPSTSPSSRFPARPCSRPPSRRSAPVRALSSSSRPASPRSAARGRAPGAAARARPRARRAADRAQLPRDRDGGPSLNATFAARSAPAGNIGFSSQSGALGVALLEAAEARGPRALGVRVDRQQGRRLDRTTCSSGGRTTRRPTLVLMYVESFGNPRRFGRLARRVARRKPILALKSGTTASGRRAASSHTAALAGSETAVDALFHQAGVIRAARSRSSSTSPRSSRRSRSRAAGASPC